MDKEEQDWGDVFWIVLYFSGIDPGLCDGCTPSDLPLFRLFLGQVVYSIAKAKLTWDKHFRTLCRSSLFQCNLFEFLVERMPGQSPNTRFPVSAQQCSVFAMVDVCNRTWEHHAPALNNTPIPSCALHGMALACTIQCLPMLYPMDFHPK